MSEWISVEDRLPEIDQRVLLGHYYNNEWCWIASGVQEEGGCWIDFDDELFEIVKPNAGCFETLTHWMPLPEPPT